jgi:glycosyltransferase involved in cell wall biosynthesis
VDFKKGGSLNMPTVAILMCTYNGQQFLSEQLDSLECQTYKKWCLIASDDGSSDKTLDILKDYQSRWPAGKLIIRSGPKKGFSYNFLSLACDPNMDATYYAFCDQDDVWLPDKLKVAIRYLESDSSNIQIPRVYCSRTIYVDEVLNSIGVSPLFSFPRSFRNALVQSIAGGNTMVFNGAVKNLFVKSGIKSVPAHDWWTYLLISGVGGEVFYDKKPRILYRQHGNALIGGNQSISGKMNRAWMLFCGRFKKWNGENLVALNSVRYILVAANLEVLDTFSLLRDASLIGRIRLSGVCGLYRQTRMGTLSLVIAILLNKI